MRDDKTPKAILLLPKDGWCISHIANLLTRIPYAESHMSNFPMVVIEKIQ